MAVEADQGHLFRIAVTGRASFGLVGHPHHVEADWECEPWTVEVRAWSLPEAMRKAAELPLSAWTHPAETQVIDEGVEMTTIELPEDMTPDRFLSVLRAFLSYLSGPSSGLAEDDRARAAGLLRALPRFALSEAEIDVAELHRAMAAAGLRIVSGPGPLREVLPDAITKLSGRPLTPRPDSIDPDPYRPMNDTIDTAE